MSKRIKVKPGKTQSIFGLLAGIVFCLIGLFVVIPSAGLFGIFWTIMAVLITVSNGINAFSDKGVSTREIIIDDHDASMTAGENSALSERKKDIELRLRAAEELYKDGTITKEEYDEKRKDILKEL